MARRSDHTREELINLAIEAGLELIEEKGFSQFSARAAASRMGYTVGTLYHLFGTLDGYILHLNAHTLDLWHHTLATGLRRQKKHPIHYLARAYIHFARDHYHRWTALFEHHLSDGEPIPEWYAQKLSQLFLLLEDSLLPYVDNNSAQAQKLGKVLWSGIHGIAVLSLSRKLEIVGTESAESLAATLVDTLLAA